MRAVVTLLGTAGLLLIISGTVVGDEMRGRAKPRLVIPFRRTVASVALFVTAAFIILTATRLTAFAFIAGLGASGLPFVLHASRRRARVRASRAQWPEVIQEIVSIVRSGSSLPEAWVRIGERDFPGLSEHFVAATSVYRSSGSFVLCLEEARIRLNDPVAEHVILALKVAYEVGGTDLVPSLRALADFVAADLATRQEIEARWSWTVSSARVAAGAPWVVLLLMLSRPETVRAYSTSGGAAVLFFAAFATAAGYLLMLRAARLPERRG